MQQHPIGYMVRSQLTELLEIEKACFPEPWSDVDFLETLRQRNCVGIVVYDGAGIVAGFALYELHRGRLRLLNLAVHPLSQRTGVATALINEMKRKLPSRNRTEIVTEVREGNLPAQLFFRSCGFKATQVLRDYYETTDESAYVFRFRIEGGGDDSRD